MIYTERKVSIKNDIATIDSPIILFRGDREVEIMFTIIDSKFKFESTKGNIIDKTQASFGQLAVALPDGTDLFTEIVECKNGVVVFSITGEMIDEIHEVGFYSFHIRLYNDDKTSRITLPPVMKGVEIREPLIIEGDVENTDLVGDATVGYSMVQTVGADEDVFDEDGNYIKTNWQTGDKITASKLNKIEETLETVNQDISNKSDKSELHNHSNKSVLDGITSGKVSSWDNKSNFDGNYNSLMNKPTIPNKTSQLTNDSGFLSSIPSEYVTDSELNAKGYLTQHQDISNKADKSEIPTKTSQLTNDSNFLTSIPSGYVKTVNGISPDEDGNVNITSEEASPIVNSIEEMTDTNKQYVYSGTNTWWVYKTGTVSAGSILPNVDNAINWSTSRVAINKRLNSSYVETDAPGSAIFYFSFDDEMQNILNTVDPVWIRMKGCSSYATPNNSTATKLTIFSNPNAVGAGAGYGAWTPYSQILAYVETEDGISDTPIASSVFNYNNNKTAPVTAIKFAYANGTVNDDNTNYKSDALMTAVKGTLALSLIVNFDRTAITEKDIEDVYITFNEPILTYEDMATEGSWYDTGIVYNVGDDNTTAILGVKITEVEDKTNELQDVVDGLEDRVDKLENSSTGGGNTSTENTTTSLPDYWKTRLDEIGEKIDTLQMENGMDTLQFLWCSDIHGVPGTSPSNTTYIGQIGRYLMDKHNIPFFVVSGDIMSQASHNTTDSIWAEYDNLAPVLSPISNEEFLAIRGNHDGVWGSPTTYNGHENRYYHSYIGDKALFNAFMRRQTLDRYKRVFGKSGMYFYVDYHNYRIYLLNGHTFGDNSVNEQGQAIYNGFSHPILGSEQIQWVADTLTTVKEDQQVLFVCHAQLNQQLDFEVFRTMINGYISRTSGNASTTINQAFWGTAAEYAQIQVSFDFANAKGGILGWFDGHVHTDSIKTDLFDNIPIFTITTAGGDVRDAYYKDGTLTRTRGTATETAIDLVTVTSDYIYFTRIGSGYDRKYNRLTKEVIIEKDSAVTPPEEPEVELTQGEITNEVSWTMDKRLSSGGDIDKDDAGSMASDYIGVKPGDTIDIYGISSLNARGLYINFYKNKTFLVNIPLSNPDNNPTDNDFAYVMYNGATKRLTIETKVIKNFDSIRVCSVTSTVTVFRNQVNIDTPIVLPEGTELYLNKRFSQSGRGLQDNQGLFAVMIPIDGTTSHTFSVANLPNGSLNTTSTTLYTIDETKTVATGVNGVNYPCNMSTGITMSDDYRSATINIPATASAHYLAFSFPVDTTRKITEADLAGIVITLDEPYDGGIEITSEVTWHANSRLSSSSGDYSTLDGSYASSDISCSNGDVIRLYNVSQGTSYNYVAAYSSAYLGFIEVAYNDKEYSSAYITANRENDVTTITILHDNVKYIRVCSNGGIDPSTVRITKNMEL